MEDTVERFVEFYMHMYRFHHNLFEISTVLTIELGKKKLGKILSNKNTILKYRNIIL